MGGRRWFNTQKSRLESEKVWISLFFGISLSGIFLNPIVITLSIALFIAAYVRRRALDESDREWAERRIFLTNPIIELCSIAIVFITIAGFIQEFFSSDFLGNVLVFTGICLLVSLAVVLIERFAHGKYFAWWGNRAWQLSKGDEKGFWIFSAVAAHKLSGYQPSITERKEAWSRQRGTPGGVAPMPQKRSTPTPKLSWGLTIIKYLLHPGRGLSYAVGVSLFLLAGLNIFLAVLLGVWVYLTTSLVADNVKYLYLYETIESGIFEHSDDTVFDRIIVTMRSHWVATLTAYVILWTVFR